MDGLDDDSIDGIPSNPRTQVDESDSNAYEDPAIINELLDADDTKLTDLISKIGFLNRFRDSDERVLEYLIRPNVLDEFVQIIGGPRRARSDKIESITCTSNNTFHQMLVNSLRAMDALIAVMVKGDGWAGGLASRFLERVSELYPHEFAESMRLSDSAFPTLLGNLGRVLIRSFLCECLTDGPGKFDLFACHVFEALSGWHERPRFAYIEKHLDVAVQEEGGMLVLSRYFSHPDANVEMAEFVLHWLETRHDLDRWLSVILVLPPSLILAKWLISRGSGYCGYLVRCLGILDCDVIPLLRTELMGEHVTNSDLSGWLKLVQAVALRPSLVPGLVEFLLECSEAPGRMRRAFIVAAAGMVGLGAKDSPEWKKLAEEGVTWGDTTKLWEHSQEQTAASKISNNVLAAFGQGVPKGKQWRP